jgi:hypothetical protein
MLLAALCTANVLVRPARADEEALRREIEALKQRLAALEQEVARNRPAAAARPSADAEALQTARGSRVQVSGFSEIRLTSVGRSTGEHTSGGDTDFQVTRFRPRIDYQMGKHLLATLQLNASSRGSTATSLNTRDAYVEYHDARYKLRMGQQKVPYGYQVYREGDEPRAALERARVFGVLFPDERDLGLVLATSPRNPRAARLAVGVVNGDGINVSDGDSQKSIAANVLLPLGRGHELGASIYAGTSTLRSGDRVVSRVKKAYGVEHRLESGRWSTQIEYLWGRALGAELNGGYGQVAYSIDRGGRLFVRHDVFDPDESAVHDYWRRTGIGWFKDFTRQFRLTAEYDFVTNSLTRGSRDNTFGIEAQSNF